MKTYVRTDWVARNEYTKPILDTPIYRNSGIIKAVTKENEKYKLVKSHMNNLKMKNFNILSVHFGQLLILFLQKYFREYRELI